MLHTYQAPTMFSVEQSKRSTKQINCYGGIFCKEKKYCNLIYITGDAGVGKTSFCLHVCFLWCKAKCGEELGSGCTELWVDVDRISKFEYVFYINLRDTDHTHELDMIIEQHFNGASAKYEVPIKTILNDKECLVLLDGMDEWTPKKIGRKNDRIPEMIHSESCVYITTCRPHKIESVRLSRQRYIDHQIHTTGLSGTSLERYVENVINYMNKENSSSGKLADFKEEIKKCGLDDQLCIPLMASYLVVLWFEKTLAEMPRVLVYANILELMFERAKQRGVEFPSTPTSTLQLPGILSGLKFLK